MFDGLVLGVDPGLSRCGLAIVGRRDRRPEIVWSATVQTSGDDPEALRLHAIWEAVAAAIATHRPSALALERVAWNVNKATAMSVARATGAVMAAAAASGVPVEEYGSLEVKNAITGMGNADKQQVQQALARVHGLADVPSESDAADAVAVALTHLVRARTAARTTPRANTAARAGAR